jgi:hypothetical protein
MHNLHFQSTDKAPVFGLASNSGQFICNVGAYGIPGGSFRHREDNIALESILDAHFGRKVFYSCAFYDRDKFYHELYDGQRYKALRKKCCPDKCLPDMYDKVITSSSSKQLR